MRQAIVAAAVLCVLAFPGCGEDWPPPATEAELEPFFGLDIENFKSESSNWTRFGLENVYDAKEKSKAGYKLRARVTIEGCRPATCGSLDDWSADRIEEYLRASAPASVRKTAQITVQHDKLVLPGTHWGVGAYGVIYAKSDVGGSGVLFDVWSGSNYVTVWHNRSMLIIIHVSPTGDRTAHSAEELAARMTADEGRAVVFQIFEALIAEI